MKITKSQLKEIIKEEVSRLQKKTILENRKKAIVREMRMLNEDVSIDENGIVERLKDGLEELEDSLSSYGMAYHIVDKIERIITEIGEEQGLSEADAEKLAEKAKIEDDSNTEYNEYDEGTVEGNVSFNGNEIVSFSSHDDGYGFRYDSEINVNALKLIAQGLLKELNGNNLNEEEGDVAVEFDVEVPDWLVGKLEQVHTKPGQGSIFAKPIKSVLELVKSHLSKMNPQEVEKIANSTGTVSLDSSGIGYDLVLPIDKAKTLKDAQQVEVEKIEGPNKIKVPAIKTSEDMGAFSTGKLTIIVRPKKDDSGNVLKGQYIVLSAFPGNPDIPRASEWGGKYAVIIPNAQMNESIRKIVREGIFSILNESVSNKIESIADKHCDDDFNWWNLMGDIKTALKEHFKNCDCSIKDLPNTDDSCGIEITKGDRSVPLMIKYDDDRGENIIKIVCKDSDETYNYEILSWENSGGESRGYDAFGYEDTTYEEEGVDCDVKNNIIEELITDIEEYLDKKHNSIK